MIDHIWSVLCSRSVIDSETNNISLQNVLEQILVDAEPRSGLILPMQYELVSFWSRTDPDIPATGRMRVRKVPPLGQVSGQREFEVDLSDHERTRTRIRFTGLPIDEPGRHYFMVGLQLEGHEEWQEVAAIPLTIGFGRPDDLPE